MSYFDGKTILITGGTGSFGKMFTSLLLKEWNPDSVRIYSRGELLQWEMQQKIHDDRLRFLIGDVRDKDRLYRAMNDVDIVVHAAALKQVPAAEYNPIEAVKTNIDGASNVINASIDNGVEKVMALSTDKAVHPVQPLRGNQNGCRETLCTGKYLCRWKKHTICLHPLRERGWEQGKHHTTLPGTEKTGAGDDNRRTYDSVLADARTGRSIRCPVYRDDERWRDLCP